MIPFLMFIASVLTISAIFFFCYDRVDKRAREEERRRIQKTLINRAEFLEDRAREFERSMDVRSAQEVDRLINAADSLYDFSYRLL